MTLVILTGCWLFSFVANDHYICENELQNCVDKPESQKKSPPLKVASPKNPLIAAYIVRQAEALERQRKDADASLFHVMYLVSVT
ncbi:unnamed protein product [Cylicocyclus nassatus]|uniref:Uncharacterized protein n=1 Tax=Cylicocyclus nassatus TaxID=53992 RepID=A0AA36MEQ1_CYLNA|nr:unnamed protein product [Cylicocyclus nassatus]